MVKFELPEFREKLNPPFVFTHDGLNLFSDLLQHLRGFFFPGFPLQSFEFPNLVIVTRVHRSNPKTPKCYKNC